MTAFLPHQSASQAGERIRSWRSLRKLSQMELAGLANISARHLSFIETGRGKASPATLLALANTLQMPLDEQNQLLLAAGFAPRYDEAPLDDDGMSHVRDVVQLILRSHEPFPAFAVDPSWNILAANEAHYALSRLMIDDDTRRQIGGDNALRLLFHPQGVKNHITNWTDVSPYLVQAVRRKSALHPNARQLATLVAEIEDWSGRATVTRNQRDVPPGDFALPMTFRIGGQRISLVTTMLSFAAPFATAVESLTIETFYPADEQSRTALEALARKSPARQ